MILFIPPLGFVFHSFRLECHPKERILLLFLLISFPNSPKRMHPRIKDKSREEMSFRSKLTTTGVEGYIFRNREMWITWHAIPVGEGRGEYWAKTKPRGVRSFEAKMFAAPVASIYAWKNWRWMEGFASGRSYILRVVRRNVETRDVGTQTASTTEHVDGVEGVNITAEDKLTLLTDSRLDREKVR